MSQIIELHRERINEHRTFLGEDIKSIIDGTLHILQLYTDILNIIEPRTMIVKENDLNDINLKGDN